MFDRAGVRNGGQFGFAFALSFVSRGTERILFSFSGYPMELPMTAMIAFIKKNLFLFGLVAAVGLAFVFPVLGADGGPLRADLLSKLGVMVIFFLQGLSLRTGELVAGFHQARLHLFVQGWIFLVSPVVLFGTGLLLHAVGHGELAPGFYYLGLLPTTIASAVAFSTAAGGNVAGALFNTTLANVLGVFWVPLGCLVLFAAGGGLQGQLIGPLLLKLTWLILLPLVVGQGLRPLLSKRAFFRKVVTKFKYINHGIILFIIFTAFSGSVLDATWEGIPAASLGWLFALTLAAVLVVHGMVWISSGWVLAHPADRISALFCGSQKTLAAGAPMAVAIFQDNGQLGGINLSLLLLPLLCYHPLQLFLAAVVLPWLARSGRQGQRLG